jgi:hypothetical protein
MSEAAASTFLTVATNIVVTSLITFRLLRARRALVNVLPAADVQVYTGVIAILIESAAPLAIFGIVSAVFQELSGSLAKKVASPGFIVCDYLFQGFSTRSV